MQKLTLTKKLEISDKILMLAERLKKRTSWENFIKFQQKANHFLIRRNYS